ncbi:MULTISPECIES: twin-arginine translocase subunit TatC [Micromonospora]|uniref:Sec-independent protein translocase protein TatC n=1 Tax=Micromonospora maris TaxID=1003110 RepID=A0A9X0I1D9_9ACTN|nr:MULTISPECIES: twin-arginine translocase subunit TatC [Micromonospora]AEB45649.1 Sec-independent protein translocase, TatC subunit [Micromonospora maris AB-18-032]KUJ45000.1 preprotein translocase subunit TatC [Micromonospora maris]RUL94951.1 twin-arginine translocase subunit TatC [Verrucosispora sp. FIM060022]
MAFALRKRGPSQFERAADGSMTLVEHFRELRTRLFRASLAIVVGLIVGYLLAQPAFDLLAQPYCRLPGMTVDGECQQFLMLAPADGFILKLKLALWIGLIVGAPVWLFQLWAFIAPGLHRHERKWAYVFVTIAAPLFAAGAVLAYFVVDKGLAFLMEAGVTGTDQQLEVTRYISFVTTMILLFGVAFEFPLTLLMLNFTGVVSAKRLLSWWRVVVFICFAFAAVATPDPGPFGMTLLALCLSLLYFIAVGVAFLNDRRKGRGKEVYAGIGDDEASPLEVDREQVAAGQPVEAVSPIEAPEPVAAPKPIERRYDDVT